MAGNVLEKVSGGVTVLTCSFVAVEGGARIGLNGRALRNRRRRSDSLQRYGQQQDQRSEFPDEVKHAPIVGYGHRHGNDLARDRSTAVRS